MLSIAFTSYFLDKYPMRQGQINYYTSGKPRTELVLQQNDFYSLVVILDEFRPGDFRMRLTKTTDGSSSYQESFLTKEELIKLRNHIDNVTR